MLFLSTAFHYPEEPPKWVIELIYHAFLERDDGVVGDGNVLGADHGAALGDVAVAEASMLLEILEPVLGVERVHLERCGVDEEPRTDEVIVVAVLP